MTSEKRPVTLITGASAGIGAALAHRFAANGHELVLVARREQALAAVADAIAATGRPRPTVLRADVARADAAQEIAAALAARDLEPDTVVNNAGFGLIGAADTLDRAEQLAMIDLNVRALTDFSLAFLDSLERRKGGILNVASIAGFLPGPGMAVYYATKAYVISFSEALHQELKPRGVRVTVLVPGPGADRVPGPRRNQPRGFSAAADAFRRAGGAGRLSRPQRGPPHGGPGFRQQGGDGRLSVTAMLLSTATACVRDACPTVRSRNTAGHDAASLAVARRSRGH